MKSVIKSLVFGDVHFNHPNTTTASIIRDLNILIPDDATTAELDIIFIAGDLWDEMVYVNSPNFQAVQRWMTRLIRLCNKYTISLRILEGTPKHDRRQSAQFPLMEEAVDLNIDIKYIDTLSIEYIEHLDINVLYVPDEWRGTNEQTKEEVIDLLAVHGLTKVDFGIMHGAFNFQVPGGLNIPVHDEEFYLSIVLKYIFISHIHRHNRYERIIGPGSTSRLAHGEEEDKGIIYVEAHAKDFSSDRVIFRVNKTAAIYKRFDIRELDRKTAMETIEAFIGNLPEPDYLNDSPIHIQILAPRHGELTGITAAFKKAYPSIRWDTKQPKVLKDSTQTFLMKKNMPAYEAVPINHNSIMSVMEGRLSTIPLNSQRLALNLLKEINNSL